MWLDQEPPRVTPALDFPRVISQKLMLCHLAVIEAHVVLVSPETLPSTLRRLSHILTRGASYGVGLWHA